MRRFFKINEFLAEFVFIFITTYFVFRKLSGYSASPIIYVVFKKEVADGIVLVLTVFVAYCLVLYVVIYFRRRFYVDDASSLGNPHYRCLLNNNREIAKHIGGIKTGTLAFGGLKDAHYYVENLQILHQNMSDHILFVLKDKRIKDKDLFISCFHDDHFVLDYDNISELSYCSHFDPTIHNTSGKSIKLNGDGCEGYAGLEAVNTGKNVVIAKISKKNYVIGNEERRKSIKHYVGIPLKIGDSVVSLLNIEFHNKSFFRNSEEIKDFIQKELQAFIYLYEYQLHKKYFFTHLPEIV